MRRGAPNKGDRAMRGVLQIRVTPEMYRHVVKMGGSRFVRKLIAEAMNK